MSTGADPRGSATTVKCISVYQSFVDWWNTSSELTKSTRSSSISNSSWIRLRKIEYDLYRTMMTDNVYIEPLKGLEELATTTTTVWPSETASSNFKKSDIVAEIIDVEIEDGIFIHEFFLENKSNPLNIETQDIVIIHGYMAATGYFLKNYESLASTPGVRVHGIDLLGFGNSSRPKFPQHLLTTKAGHFDKIRQVLDCEIWFIESIEKWRIKRGIKNFKLIAHSMGAYLLSCYLMKYNHQYGLDHPIVTEFIAVSPMGTEPNPLSLLLEESHQFNHYSIGGDPFRELVANQNEIQSKPKKEDYSKIWDHVGAPKFPKNAVLKFLWDHHISPFQVLQYTGPFYSKLLSYWSFQRFANLSPNDGSSTKENEKENTEMILKLHEYSYSIFNQFQGSGELAITMVINEEILPRLPLAERGFVKFLSDSHIKILWVYGDKDWMNRKGGEYIHDKLVTEGADSTFKVIQQAGHHIYLDNPSTFNETCLSFFT